MRTIRVLILSICVLLGSSAPGDTFKLTNGETLTGEALVTSANDGGIQIKVGDGKYEKVSWASFSQEDLKKFAENPKLQPLVEPFIEISQEERIKKTEVPIKPPPRLPRPPPQSLFGSFFGSSLGLFVLLVLYAANIYAAYEVAIFRAQPVAMVCGVSAVAPLIGPIVFLSMPTKLKPTEAAVEVAAEGASPVGEGAGADVNPMLAEGVAHPTGLKLHHDDEPKQADQPETTVFQRGQFTFNRRFFETKFAGFFGVVRRDAERDLVLVIKSGRGEYAGQRITRIAANDLHLQVQKGHATEEVMIPFQEITEIQLRHKSAKT